MQSAFFRERRWKPWDRRGARRSRIRFGATLLMRFQPELGLMSGPGADQGEEQAKALSTSDASSAATSQKGRRMVWGSSIGQNGKK